MKEFFNRSKKRKWLFLRVMPAVVLIAVIFFLFRGPYLSNSIKRVLIPVLENATGEKIITDHAVINLFPFYLQVKSIKVFDKDGNRLLWVTKTRAYIDVLALFRNEIRIRKLTLREPSLTAAKEDIERVVENVQKYLSRGGDNRFNVSLKSIRLRDGNFSLTGDEEFSSLSGSGLSVDMLVKNDVTVDLFLKNGILRLQDISELRYGINGRIKISKDGRVDISNVEIQSLNSKLVAKGDMLFSMDGRVSKGNLYGKAKIFAETVNKLFGFEKAEDGVLSFSGSVDLVPREASKWPGFAVNLKTKGFFYLETLMRLLKVEETITGRLSVDGKISGIYPDLLGEGAAKLENAVFDTLLLDNVIGKIKYQDRRFTLKNFTAHTYGGKLKGDAYILIPRGDYSVTASVSDVVSTKFFEFIKWGAPFLEGNINGDFKLNKIRGQDFEVTAVVNYINTTTQEGGPLTRLKSINGKIDFRNKVVGIRNSVFSTVSSKLYMNGDIDLKQKSLVLDILLDSADVSDLTIPLFTDLRAPVRFTGRAKGDYGNPEILGNLKFDSGSIRGFAFTHASADLTYKMRELSLKSLRIEHKNSTYNVSGSVMFRKAESLFSFEDPFYNYEISIDNGDAESLISAIYKKVHVKGSVDGMISLKGDSSEYNGKGDLLLREGVIYGQEFDRVVIKAAMDQEKVDFQHVDAYKDETKLFAKGVLYFDERFKVSLTSEKVRLNDITFLHDYPADALFSLNLNGSGTLKNPYLEFSMNVYKGSFRDIQIGSGKINGVLDNRELLFKGGFLEDMILTNGRVAFSDSKPPSWTVYMDFKDGNYNFLLSGLLKDVPKDVSASIEGTVKLSGRGKEVSMQSRFSSVNFSLYGYTFGNKEDIILELSDRKLKIKSFSLTGDEADVSIAGDLNIGKSFDVKMKGNLDIAPLRALTDKITSLKGQGEFAINLSGSWDTPDITGEIGIKGVTVSVAGYPYKVGPLSGDIFLKKDRLIFESLKTNLAGGTAEITGVGYFKRLSLKRLFASAVIRGVRLSHIEDVSAVVDGELFYETSSKGAALTGDINIKRAKYAKRVEWKSWLLGLKETRRVTAERPTFLEKTALNIRVVGKDNISVDNNITRTFARADLTVLGTVGRYGLIGSVETKEGNVYFRGNEFEIINGRVDFVEPNNIAPVFNIQAKTFTGGYRIMLNLEGSMDKFALSLLSDPHLSEMDILTLLTSGQINKEEKGFESGIAASEATAILTGSLQDVVEERVKNIVGIERFEVDPQTTSTGVVSPRITVGKRMLDDRLTVIYTTSIGTTEEHIIKLKYNLGKNVSIIGTRDERGGTGADINYRFEFK